MANGLLTVLNDENLRQQMIEKGYAHAAKFTNEKCAENVMNVYKALSKY